MANLTGANMEIITGEQASDFMRLIGTAKDPAPEIGAAYANMYNQEFTANFAVYLDAAAQTTYADVRVGYFRANISRCIAVDEEAAYVGAALTLAINQEERDDIYRAYMKSGESRLLGIEESGSLTDPMVRFSALANTYNEIQNLTDDELQQIQDPIAESIVLAREALERHKQCRQRELDILTWQDTGEETFLMNDAAEQGALLNAGLRVIGSSAIRTLLFAELLGRTKSAEDRSQLMLAAEDAIEAPDEREALRHLLRLCFPDDMPAED